jgi:hypothetical protein
VNWQSRWTRFWVTGSAIWAVVYIYILWATGVHDSRLGTGLNGLVAIRTRPWDSIYLRVLNDLLVLDYLGIITGLAGPPILALAVAWYVRWIAKDFKR